MDYIIFNKTIGNIGGAEIYTYNKLNFLKSLRMKVTIYSACYDPIYITQFSEFKDNIIPEINIDPFIFTEKRRQKILKILCDKLISTGVTSNTIIESHTIQMSLWAELISNKLGCKNFTFLLDDEFRNVKKSALDFLYYKLQYKQLACIESNAVDLLFKDRSINENQHYALIATCSTAIREIEENKRFIIQKEGYDLTVGVISRLEKKCVRIVCDAILKYIKSNKNKRIKLILIGGTKNKKKLRKLRSVLSGYENLNLVITGYMFPIPKKFVQQIDLFIGVAGSATSTARLQIPTIVVDQNNGKPFGYLTDIDNYYQFVDEGFKYQWPSLETALSDILENGIHLDSYIPEKNPPKLEPTFYEHLDFVKNMLIPERQYNFDLYDYGNKKKKVIFNLIISFLGVKRFSKFFNLLKG